MQIHNCELNQKNLYRKVHLTFLINNYQTQLRGPRYKVKLDGLVPNVAQFNTIKTFLWIKRKKKIVFN